MPASSSDSSPSLAFLLLLLLVDSFFLRILCKSRVMISLKKSKFFLA
eukprot:13050.XXX_588103_588243_1 [CDS] Oithona nana genome sequencing.